MSLCELRISIGIIFWFHTESSEECLREFDRESMRLNRGREHDEIGVPHSRPDTAKVLFAAGRAQGPRKRLADVGSTVASGPVSFPCLLVLSVRDILPFLWRRFFQSYFLPRHVVTDLFLFWRRYINYFATKPSPTDQILNLWEARNREESALNDMVAILRVMDRLDVVELLQSNLACWLWNFSQVF